MKDKFFKQYPGALHLWQVGNKLFLNGAKDKAEYEAAITGKKLEKVTPATAKDRGSKK